MRHSTSVVEQGPATGGAEGVAASAAKREGHLPLRKKAARAARLETLGLRAARAM